MIINAVALPLVLLTVTPAAAAATKEGTGQHRTVDSLACATRIAETLTTSEQVLLLVEKARLLRSRNRLSEALTQLEKARKLSPAALSYESALNLALAHVQLGNIDAGIQYAMQRSDRDQCARVLAELVLAIPRPARTAAARQLTSDSRNCLPADALSQSAVAAAAGQSAEALSLLRSSDQKDPAFGPRVALAAAAIADAGDFDAAISTLELVGGAARTLTLLGVSNAAFNAGKHNLARRLFEDALSDKTSSIYLLPEAATICRQLKRLDLCRRLTREAERETANQPGQVGELLEIAHAYARMGQSSDANRVLRNVVRQSRARQEPEYLLVSVVSPYIELGSVRQAVLIAERLADPYQRARAFLAVSVAKAPVRVPVAKCEAVQGSL